MTPERWITFDAVVIEILPGGKCRVRLPNGHEATVDRPIPPSEMPDLGDAVLVEISPYDGAGPERLLFRRVIRKA